MSMDFTYTPEELAYMEHKLEIERQKCSKAIERQKQVIEELQPKGFSGMFSKNKEKIKKEEETLTLLEDQYIELTTKTGMDLLIEEKSGMRVVSALVCMFHYADLENAGASAAPWSSQPP